MSRTLRVFEHGSLHAGRDLTQPELDALVRFNDAHAQRYFAVGHRRITMRSFVGYVEIGSLSIEILPKADRAWPGDVAIWQAGLLEMLSVALGMRLDAPSHASQRVARARLLDLVALAYATELGRLLHHGLAKGYRETEGNGCTFRGRLKVPEHLRENLARADRFYVAYQTYDHDVAVNRALGAALDELGRCALSPGTAAYMARCRGGFPEVDARGVTPALFDRIRLGRTTARYEAALVYARMILEQQAPQLRAGAARVFALLFDMNVLWERYVAALFRRAAIPGITIGTQERRPFWHAPGHSQRHVRPDIVVRAATSPPETALLVVDTKWKVPHRGVPSDDDLKQAFVYNELLDAPRSVLLYPTTSGSRPATGRYARREHSCEQLYLGVLDHQRWSTPAMTRQVGELLDRMLGEQATDAGKRGSKTGGR